MNSVPVIVSLLALSQIASAAPGCRPQTPVYNATINNACAKQEDNNIYWPDYRNVNQYVRCQGIGNPVVENCLPNYVFDFVAQVCTLCSKYTPAPPCQSLKGKTCTAFKPVATVAPNTTTTSPSSCNSLATYTGSFRPTCLGNDDRLLWPNYRNISEYYRCQGEYNPLIVPCETGLYFNFDAQRCTKCDAYVAAPECSKLPFDKSNKCQKL